MSRATRLPSLSGRSLWPAMVLVAAACGNSTAPSLASVAGEWTGQIATGPGTSVTISLSLTHGTRGHTIAGTGNLSVDASVVAALSVTGTYVGPGVTLNLNAPGFAPVIFTGNHAGNSMTGVANGGPGFVNTPLNLIRR